MGRRSRFSTSVVTSLTNGFCDASQSISLRWSSHCTAVAYGSSVRRFWVTRLTRCLISICTGVSSVQADGAP